MKLTDKRQSIIIRQQHSRSKHSIQSKSPPLFSTSTTSQPLHQYQSRQCSHIDKQNYCSFNLARLSATDTPEFNQDPSKFVYDCQKIYALLESVKIERNHQSSLELIQLIRNTITRLGEKRGLTNQIQALERILINIEKKLGYKVQQKSQKSYIEQYPSTTQHEIEFSLVSNWKQMIGKEIIYTNFSLIDQNDHIQIDNPKESTTHTRSSKQSRQSVSSNVLITDLNLQIQMLDSLLQGKLKRKSRTLHTSINSQTIRKGKAKRVFY